MWPGHWRPQSWPGAQAAEVQWGRPCCEGEVSLGREDQNESHVAYGHMRRMHTGKHLLIRAHLTTPLEQGNLGLALAVLVDELVKKGGDNRPLLQSRLAAFTSRGHCETAASNCRETRYSVKRGFDPSSRASAGASAGELRAHGGAEGQVQRHGLCHGHRSNHGCSDRPVPMGR